GLVLLRARAQQRITRRDAQFAEAEGAVAPGQLAGLLQAPARQALRFEVQRGERAAPRLVLQRTVQRQRAGELAAARVQFQSVVAFAAFGQQVDALEREAAQVRASGREFQLAREPAEVGQADDQLQRVHALLLPAQSAAVQVAIHGQLRQQAAYGELAVQTSA